MTRARDASAFPNPPPPAASARLKAIFAGICALLLTVGLARFAYTPLLPIMRAQAGLSDVAGGWLATVNYAGYMSGALLAATLSDLHRKFLLYRWGLVLGVASTAAMGLTDHVWLWGVLRYIAGFSSTAGLLLASGLVLNWLMRHGHKPELGLHFVGLGLGIAVSGCAVAAMEHWLRWDQQWLGLGALALLLFVPAWAWMPAPAPLTAHASPSPSHAGTTAMSPTGPSARWMRLMIAAYFCAGFGFVISATFTVAMLVKLPVLAGKGSWVWIVVGLVAGPSGFVWDRIASALGQVRALMLAYGLQTLCFVLPALSQGVALNVLAALLFGATFVGIVSLTLTLIGRHFPANPAKAMARMTLSYGVAQMAAPAMTGYIVTATGSYHGALVVTALVMLLGIVLLQGVRRAERADDRLALPA